MKIAYITSAYGRASDTFIRNEIKELRRFGHTVETFSIRLPEASHIVDAEISEERARTIYLLSAGIFQFLLAALLEFFRSPLRFLRAFSRTHQLTGDGFKNRLREFAYLLEAAYLARQLRRKKCQHIHDHIGENSSVVAATAALLTHIPYSLTLHGPSIFYAPDQFRLARKIHLSAFTICISYFAKSQCMTFTPPADWPKLHIVHCPVGDQFIHALPTPVPDVPRFLSVGRLSPEKGQLLLIEAVSLLQHRNIHIALDIVGDGPSKTTLQAQIARLNLSESIHLLGWKNPQEIVQLLQDSRAFILPSFAEGLPVVLMESLALGRPAITTAIAGIPELVDHNQSGWLVSPGSAEMLASAIETALATSAYTLTEMGRHGRTRVLAQHDPATEAAKLAHLFEETNASL